MTRALLYAALGLLLEALYTGAASGLRGDRTLATRGYLWMAPVYAAGGLALDRTRAALLAAGAGLGARAAAYVVVIFAVEYACGAALRTLLGRCPWDYSDDPGPHLHGLIRLGHAPAWYGCAALFELLQNSRVMTFL